MALMCEIDPFAAVVHIIFKWRYFDFVAVDVRHTRAEWRQHHRRGLLRRGVIDPLAGGAAEGKIGERRRRWNRLGRLTGRVTEVATDDESA